MSADELGWPVLLGAVDVDVPALPGPGEPGFAAGCEACGHPEDRHPFRHPFRLARGGVR